MTAAEASGKIRSMIQAIQSPDLTLAVTSVIDEYISQIEESFASASGPDGEPWEPIVYRDVPPAPLELSGALKESVIADAHGAVIDQNGMGFSTTGDQLVEYALGQDQGQVFSRGVYVGWVQKKYGVKVHMKTITWHPGRPFLGFGEETLDAAAEYGAEEAAAQAMGVW